MLSLRLVALLLFLLPLVCPKPRPAHYLIETEDGQADHSAEGDDADDSSDNGTGSFSKDFFSQGAVK